MSKQENDRPNPDALLRIASQDEQKKLQGKLRIFLGMSAGVGKTFAMLKAAQVKQQEGVEVLVGVVETHGRKETEALVTGLTVLPKAKVPYKDIFLEELDLDEILKRRPKLVLVDELAHSNVPGSRHPKRYQDVLEILAAGIDVYTAMNVQHLESRKDLVEKVAGIPIRETVPDSIFDIADQIEVIDITPVDLLKRLKEGKVYLADRADRAAANFFKIESLTALREMALRFAAERVDQDLQTFHELKSTSPWQSNERLMVAVSHSPHSEKLIRATRRLAYNLEAPWIAVYVDTGASLSQEDQDQLAKNIALARELNAEVISTSDRDVAEALKRVARQKNVTQVLVGRPARRWIA
ncbi:MAG: two-component sensor histidine kinase, partial [Proteobacteria bacterium]